MSFYGNASSLGVELPFPCTLFSKHDGAVRLAIAKQGAGSENCSKECISVGKYSQQDQKANNGVEI